MEPRAQHPIVAESQERSTDHHVKTLARVVIVPLVVEDFRHLALRSESGRSHETSGVDSPHDDIAIALRHGEAWEEAWESEDEMEVETHDVDGSSFKHYLASCQSSVVAELTADVDGVGGVFLHVEDRLATISDTANEQYVKGSRKEGGLNMTHWNCNIVCDRVC